MIHGDTPSTSRLYDAIRSGSLPIFISNDIIEQGLPFVDKIYYEDFAFFIDHTLPTLEIIRQIEWIVTEVSEDELRRRHQIMLEYAKDLCWKHEDSRVAENILLEASDMNRCRL